MSISPECLNNLCHTLVAASFCGGAALLGVHEPPVALLEAFIGLAGLASVLGTDRAQRCERILSRVKRKVARNYDRLIKKESREIAAERTDLNDAERAFNDVIPRIVPAPHDLIGQNLNENRIVALLLERASAANPIFAKTTENLVARRFFQMIVGQSYALIRDTPEFGQKLQSYVNEALLTGIGDIKTGISDIREGMGATTAAVARIEAALRDDRVMMDDPQRRKRPIVDDISSAHTDLEHEPRYLPHRLLTVFVSHAAADGEEARSYLHLFQFSHFTVLPRGEETNVDAVSRAQQQILKCHFFLLLISDNSLSSERVQRELSFALETRERNNDMRPFIIPIFLSQLSNRKAPDKDFLFPYRTPAGELAAWDIKAARSFDKHLDPEQDSDEMLLSMMKPRVWVSLDDFDHLRHQTIFDDSDIFKLYKRYFPDIEQDGVASIQLWCTRKKDIINDKHTFFLAGQKKPLDYQLHSKFFIITVMNKAIGGAFFTYDHRNNLMLGNYVLVDERWRGGDTLGHSRHFLVSHFLEYAQSILLKYFRQCDLWVFEVEPFTNEPSSDRRLSRNVDPKDDDKYKRVLWYESTLGCKFFKSVVGQYPLEIISPCLDTTVPPDEWSNGEAPYWLLVYSPSGSIVSGAEAKLWKKVVKAVYIEIIAKSLAERADSSVGARYWRYARGMILKQLRSTAYKNVSLGPYFTR